MPSGYTVGVRDGTVVEFRTFALQCARAFGALLPMRDEPHDAPIPDRFAPSDYHQRKLHEARRRLAELNSMTPEQREEAAKEAHAKEVGRVRQANERSAVARWRYEAMLAQVEAWKPPTRDHENLKVFMREQLAESIKFDCFTLSEPEPLDAQTWHQKEVDEARRAIDYHAQQHAEEVARTGERNAWLASLRDSLPEGGVTTRPE